MKLQRMYFVALCSLSACRLAGPDELVGHVSTAKPDSVEAGASAAPEELPTAARLATPTCPPLASAPLSTSASLMVDVPAGTFPMGCNAAIDEECKPDEDPPHDVTLSGFRIDVTEVTQAQYRECVESGACLAPTCDWDPCGGRANHPVVCVNRVDAIAYCTAQGKRLPTEAEWEKAARGPAGTKFPWGNDPVDCIHANVSGCVGGTEPVGSHPSGASKYGALDMAGNVVEWVSDRYDATYYAVSPAADPQGPAPIPNRDVYVGRGGGWNSTEIWHRTSARDDYEGTYFKKTFGIRCAAAL
jgi:formylglycine-generating enzyme